MSRGARLLVVAVVAVVLVGTLAIGATAAAVYHGGTLAVDVRDDDGSRVRVAVPGGLARIAIWLVPTSLVEQALVDEVRPWLRAAHDGWRELARSEDFVMVDVRSADEHVRVRKIGRSLHVEVRSPGTDVAVVVPLRAVGAALAKLDRAAG